MNRKTLSPLVALIAASFGAPFSIDAASAATVNISGASCTWDGSTLNCVASNGTTTAGAPSCTVSASTSSLASTGGNVTLNASCNPAATSYNWQKNGQTMSGGANNAVVDTLPANTGATAVTTTYSVQGCVNGSTCGNFASATVSVAGTSGGGGGGGGGTGLCTAADNAIMTTLTWGSGFVTQNLPNGKFPGNATVVAAFTVPGDYGNTGVGSINVAEYGGPPTLRLVTLSTQACDFRIGASYDPTGTNAPLTAGAGTTASVQWSTTTRFGVAKLVPGQTYYINIKNKDFRSGTQTCASGSSCDAIVQFGMP